MASISVGFSRSKHRFAVIGWLIQLVERTAFSHAHIRTHSASLDRDLIYQATGAGIYFVGTTDFDSHHAVVEEYSFEISEEAKKKFLRWAIDNSGKKYSQLEVIGLGVKRLAAWVGIKIPNPFKPKGSEYVCTTLAAAALEEVGVVDWDPEELDVRDLHEAVVALHKKV